MSCVLNFDSVVKLNALNHITNAPVKAGVTLEVSNGQVEGQNNRLKMLKRQMFGRAGLALLEKRLILNSKPLQLQHDTEPLLALTKT